MSDRLEKLVNEFNAADAVPLQIRSEDSGDGPLELMVHGTIGDYWEYLDSASLVGVLNENKGRDILMRVNSPGGSVFDGIAVHTALLNHDGKVTARIEGIAASAASFLTTAADEIEIAKAGSYMIHRAWGVAIGNTQAMADMAGVLNKLDGQIADLYSDRTGVKSDEIIDWMVGEEDGTWFNASEALEHGFVDRILPGTKSKTSNSLERNLQNLGNVALKDHRRRVSSRLHRIQVDDRLEQIKLDASRVSE